MWKRLNNLIAATMSHTVHYICPDPAVRVPTMAGAVALSSCPPVLIEGDMEFTNNGANSGESRVSHTHVSFSHPKDSRQTVSMLHAADAYYPRVAALARRL